MLQVVGVVTMRISKGRDLVLDNGKLLIPRDTIIHLPIGLPHTSSAVFEEAHVFKPERWLAPDADYMPAGADPPLWLLVCLSVCLLTYLLS